MDTPTPTPRTDALLEEFRKPASVTFETLVERAERHFAFTRMLECEIATLTRERDEARQMFNEIDLCQLGQAPCKYAQVLQEEIVTLRAKLNRAPEQIKEWLRVLDETLNSGDGSYRP